jgi:hypothetical protein
MYYSAPPTLMYDLAHAESPTRSGLRSRRTDARDSRWPILASINVSAALRVSWLRSLSCWGAQATAAFSARGKAGPNTADCVSP